MQFKKLISIFFVILLTTYSCIKVDKSLGENLVPTNQELKVMVAELDLPVDLKLSDSLQGVSSRFVNIGAINTKDFGLAEFFTAANLSPIKKNFRFGKDPVIKSIWFSGVVSNKVTLQDNQEGIPQNIYIYKLNKAIDTNQVYNNSLSGDFYNPTPLNSIQSTFLNGDTIKVFLDNKFGSELLSATEEELDSLDLFVKRFGGLVIKCSTPENGIIGGRLNKIAFSSAIINIKYNFQPTWENGLGRKDTTVTFGFGNSYCLNLSSYSSGKLQTNEPTEKLYIEGIAGIKPYINYSKLKDIIDNWINEKGYNKKTILLSKAILTFPFEIPENYDMSNYPSLFYMAKRSDSLNVNKPYYYPCAGFNKNGNDFGFLNRSLQVYEINIPTEIQNYFSKSKLELNNNYDLWFFPLTFIETANKTRTYSLGTTEYYGCSINGLLSNRKPKLKIVYSVLE